MNLILNVSYIVNVVLFRVTELTARDFNQVGMNHRQIKE